MEWYPLDKEELNEVLERFLASGETLEEVHGLVVPHAGYVFSGAIAGKAFSLLKGKKAERAVILGPSHYIGFGGVMALDKIETPLGKIRIIDNNYKKIEHEHSIENQIPFLQKLGIKEILPLIIGEIDKEEAQEIAKLISEQNAVYIFSTDLSHFLPYEEAVKKDKKSIEIIENLDFDAWNQIDACGKFPLLVMMYLCKINNWKPKLIEYKNSGDITEDKSSVVGYASFSFN